MTNCQFTWFILILVIVFIAICTGLIIFGIVSISRHRKRLEDLTLYQINTSAKIDESIPEILSLIINECFEDYQVKTLLPLDEGHINSTREAIIRKELVEMVSNRISSAAFDKLSLYYNINNIANIMADKIYITVMNYVINHNAAIEEK